MFNYIRTVFTKPKEIYIARNMKIQHYFSLIFVMGLLLTILSFFEILPITNQFSRNYTEIKDSIPEFELVNAELESDTSSYIYQTDSVLFYFDSEDVISTELIDSNTNIHPAPISIGLLKEQVYFNVTGTTYSIIYSNFSDLTSEDLMNLFNSVGEFSPFIYVLFLFILIGLNLFLFVTQLIPITLSANLISVYRKTRLSFTQNAKISLLASIGPFLLMYIINALPFTVNYQFEVILTASLLLFNVSLSEMKKRIIDQHKED